MRVFRRELRGSSTIYMLVTIYLKYDREQMTIIEIQKNKKHEKHETFILTGEPLFWPYYESASLYPTLTALI